MKTIYFKNFGLNKFLRPLFAFIAFFISSSLFAAAITWDAGGGADTDWSTAANWSTNTVPTSADQVTVAGVYTVTVSTNVGTINKLILTTSAAGAPKLVITADGTLTVSNSTTTAQVQIALIGGEIQNAGTLNITTYTGASIGLDFRTSTSTVPSVSTYSGSGVLNINSSAGTSACINFSQTDATSIFTLGGTINLTPAAANYAITSLGGSAKLNGTGTLSAGINGANVGYGLLSISSVSVASTITVEAGVTLNSYTSNTYSAFSAPIFFGATIGNSLVNKGTINIGGVNSNNGIYCAPTSVVNSIDNQGTINFSGAFPTSAITFGGTGTSNFTNSGTVTVANMTSTASIGIKMSATPIVNITNSGTMTFDATNATTGAMINLGDDGAVFNNTGTVTLNKGCIMGTSGSGVAAFNNQTGGVVAINAGAGTAISTLVLFTNNGGTFEGSGTVAYGCFTPSTGTISPGGSGIGLFTFYSANLATFNLTGKCLMSVNGKTTAGTDFDKIQVSTTGATLDVSGATLEMTVGGGYTPAINDNIQLFAGNVAVTGNFLSLTSPAINWAMDYTTSTAAKVKFATATPVITWTQDLSGLRTNDAPVTLTASSNAGSNGATITYTSSDPSVVSVSGTTLTVVGAGSATVTAHQASNSYFNAASNVSQSAVVVVDVPTSVSKTVLESGVYSLPNQIVISAAKGNKISVFTATGQLINSFKATDDKIVLSIEKGIYIVGVGARKVKVVVQ